MLFEVRFAQKAAVSLHEIVDLIRDLTCVKSVAAFLADQAQAFCERGIFEDVAFRRRAPFAVERISFEKTARHVFVERHAPSPVISDQLRDRKTFLGVTDRRREIVAQFEFAEFLVQLRPRIHRSRHTDRQHAERRNCFAMQLGEFGLHLIVTQAKRRTSAAVQAVKLVLFRAVNDREQVAADPVRDRLHQTERRVCGDRSINRATATFQNVDPDLRRCRHTGANHSVPCKHFRSRREIFSRDAVDLGEERLRGDEKSKGQCGKKQSSHPTKLDSCQRNWKEL